MGKADRATPSKKQPRAVLDPSLPLGDRKAIEWLHRTPSRRFPTGGALRRSLRHLAQFSLIGVAGLVCLLAAVPAGAWLKIALIVVGLTLVFIAALPMLAALPMERRISAAGRRILGAKGRYVLPDELDETARKMLRRTQSAIRTVQRSQVNEADLLDRIHNEVLLPSVEWELAKMLRYSTQLRAEHPEFEETEQTLDVAHSAYQQAEQVIADRVSALERYAERVLAADIAYQTAGGDFGAMDALELLSGQADATAGAFHQSLDRVREAAAELTQKPHVA